MARNATGLRRSVLRSKKSRGSGSKGWRGNFRDRMSIPKASGTHMLLTRGEYPNPEDVDEKGEPGIAAYHTCLTHAARLSKGGPGSFFSTRCHLDHAVAEGKTEDDADCVACLQMSEGDKRLGYKRKSTYSFNALHLALYEKVHEKDRDGKKRYYDRDYGENIKRGDPVMVWEEVTKPRAKKRIEADIDALLEAGEVRMIAKKYLEVGSGFREQLASIEDESSKMCMCGGDLTPLVFSCEKCEEVLADVEDDDMDDEEIDMYSKDRQRCEHCGHQGFPIIQPVCSDCDDPQALTPFDVVVKVRKRGEGTNTTLIFDEITPLPDYVLPNGASLVEWEEEDDGGEDTPVFDEDGNWKFSEEFDIEKLATNQFDFEKVHSPMDNSRIASKLGCNNPFGSSKSGSARSGKYANYGNKGRSKGRDEEEEDTDDDASVEEESPIKKKKPARRVRRRTR